MVGYTRAPRRFARERTRILSAFSPIDQDAGILVVADGLGGVRSGELASRLVG